MVGIKPGCVLRIPVWYAIQFETVLSTFQLDTSDSTTYSLVHVIEGDRCLVGFPRKLESIVTARGQQRPGQVVELAVLTNEKTERRKEWVQRRRCAV